MWLRGGLMFCPCWLIHYLQLCREVFEWVRQRGSLSLLCLLCQLGCLVVLWGGGICLTTRPARSPLCTPYLSSPGVSVPIDGHYIKKTATPSRWQCGSLLRTENNDCGAIMRGSRGWHRGPSTLGLLPLPNRYSRDGGAHAGGSLPAIQASIVFSHWFHLQNSAGNYGFKIIAWAIISTPPSPNSLPARLLPCQYLTSFQVMWGKSVHQLIFNNINHSFLQFSPVVLTLTQEWGFKYSYWAGNYWCRLHSWGS